MWMNFIHIIIVSSTAPFAFHKILHKMTRLRINSYKDIYHARWQETWYMFMIHVQEKSHHDQMVSSLASKHPGVN